MDLPQHLLISNERKEMWKMFEWECEKTKKERGTLGT